MQAFLLKEGKISNIPAYFLDFFITNVFLMANEFKKKHPRRSVMMCKPPVIFAKLN